MGALHSCSVSCRKQDFCDGFAARTESRYELPINDAIQKMPQSDLVVLEAQLREGAATASKTRSRLRSFDVSGEPKAAANDTDDFPIEEKHAVCLAWLLHLQAQSTVTTEQLCKLSDQIRTCSRLFDAEVLEDRGTGGLIRVRPQHRMTAEDGAVRLGQLLCRWAATEKLGILVGVHTGCLRQAMVRGRMAYAGDASARATQLAVSGGREWMVHMSTQVKERLSVFKHIRVEVSPSEGYYLDLVTGVKTDGERRSESKRMSSTADEAVVDSNQDSSIHPSMCVAGDGCAINIEMERPGDHDIADITRKSMTLAAFEELLKSHGVDVTKFGQFPAKTLKEFYTAVVTQQKCSLVVEGASNLGGLHRIVNLVRISLCIRDSENKVRELRMATEQTSGGKRCRDQPLAVVLKMGHQGKWLDAIETCFEETLQLTPSVQRACFAYDMDSYRYTEHTGASDTIPGIITTYRSHNITINIKDRRQKELACVGLPEGTPFSKELATSGSGARDKGRTWMWVPVGNKNEDELMSTLQRNGIDVSEFPQAAFAELYDEVYESGLSTLREKNGALERSVCIVKLWLHAAIFNVDHVLVVKAKKQRGQHYVMDRPNGFSMRMRVDQAWQDAAEEALLTRLGLTPEFVREHLTIHKGSHKLTEELGYSQSFVGLRTLYHVNEVTVCVNDSFHEHLGTIGLPSGTDFTFVRRPALKGPETGDTVVTHWCWRAAEEINTDLEQHKQEAIRVHAALSDGAAVVAKEAQEDLEKKVRSWSSLFNFSSRVPDPEALSPAYVEGRGGEPVEQLAALMRGRETDWNRGRNAAQRIRDKDYSNLEFFSDITAAFPELRLYCIEDEDTQCDSPASISKTRSGRTSSGRTACNEYQRTIGALFAVRWLMRLDLDGKECFCFGLDGTWGPRSDGQPEDTSTEDVVMPQDIRSKEEIRKRRAFYDDFDWRALRTLMIDADLLVISSGADGKASVTHDPDRTLAVLVLMAIHDVMKLTLLLPKVSAEVGEFCGYREGETVSDHDAALNYVLVHHPHLLPSFAGLSNAQKESIRFTQCKMDYNMGWLVQAEAPPGALFRTMRKMASGQVEATMEERDIAFYFVHWFCDLAAAEPCPLNGMDKFVLKFPIRVLGQFIASFGVVQTLSKSKTETMVLEDYLVERWHQHEPFLGAVPKGPGAIARARLVLMAQGDSAKVLRAFAELPAEDRAALSEEMAITGLRGQSFLRDSLAGSEAADKGPAVLVYYSPALMQRAGREDPSKAMRILADLYRAARQMWPLSADAADATVTVRIDALKDLECSAIFHPDAGCRWVLHKTSGQDAHVERLTPAALKEVDWDSHVCLHFGNANAEAHKPLSRPRFRHGSKESGARTG